MDAGLAPMIEVRLEGDDRNQHEGLRAGLVVRRATSLGYGAPRKIDAPALPIGAMLDVRVAGRTASARRPPTMTASGAATKIVFTLRRHPASSVTKGPHHDLPSVRRAIQQD